MLTIARFVIRVRNAIPRGQSLFLCSVYGTTEVVPSRLQRGLLQLRPSGPEGFSCLWMHLGFVMETLTP